MDFIAILGVFCLISAVITYGLGIFVYAKNPMSTINRLFLLVTLGASYWAVGEYLLWSQNTYENVWFWLKASSLWTLVIVLCIHFILTFADHPLSKPDKFRYLILILYIPALLFTFINIFTDSIFTVGYSPSFRYYYTPATFNPVYLITTIYFLLLLSWGVYVGFKSQVSSGKERLRGQSFSISLGLLILIGFGSQSVIILPMFGIFAPNLVFIGIVFFSLAISYAILRYGLFIITPETVASNIIQTMPDGLILTDMNGDIITINASATMLLSGSPKENPEKLTGPPFPDPVLAEIKKAIQNKGGLTDFEVSPERNTAKTLSIAGSLISDPYGKPAGMILIIRDITERKVSEKALILANEKISLLNRLTRHDISNQVTALAGYLDVLKDEEDEQNRSMMLSTCIGLVDKITHHLTFSREYQNIGLHDPTWQPVETLVMRAIREIHKENVEISVQLILVEVYADPLSIKVIYNLLENAIRHAAGLTHIRISAEEKPDGNLMLIIEDNGIGIRPEEKERIFLQGYGKNTGLGLTLSREILAVTGITIIENGEMGKGARFEINIPPGSWRKPDRE